MNMIADMMHSLFLHEFKRGHNFNIFYFFGSNTCCQVTVQKLKDLGYKTFLDLYSPDDTTETH